MGLSRNKVAVPEGAAGSPPFYGVFVGCPVWVSVWGNGFPCLGGRGFPLLVWKRSGEHPWWGVWCGACCWVPGPPTPPGWGLWRRCAPVLPPALCGSGRAGRVWWWFENWRVDASDGLAPLLLWGCGWLFVLRFSNMGRPRCGGVPGVRSFVSCRPRACRAWG